MTENSEPEGLSSEELEAHAAEELPDREAMSLLNANVAAPVNVLSDDSTATASAEQTADSDQST